MRVISSGVAMIEDNDLTTEEIKIRQQELLEYLQDFNDMSLSKAKLLKIIDVANTKENEEKYILPLVEEGLLKPSKKGTTNYYKYQGNGSN
jgi:predicted transcriptional regulator